MRVVVIGGSGHIGTYLVPMLVAQGHDVINMTRGQFEPYVPNPVWASVRQVKADREAEEREGIFGQHVRDLKPDVVIDLICYREESARQMTEALRGEVQHYVHCGTIWVYGHSTQVPATEDQPCRPFGTYGIGKAAVESVLLGEARRTDFPVTILRLGHITGPGYAPVNPLGNYDVDVFNRIARGDEIALPNFGLETVHHVHAIDAAQAFIDAMAHRNVGIGECFHICSPAALTLRGYAEAVYDWFGQEPHLRFLPWDAWRASVSDDAATRTWDHIAHSPNASIAKARRLINFQPKYSSLEAVRDSVNWYIKQGVIRV